MDRNIPHEETRMSPQASGANKAHAFLDAKLSSSRLVNEEVKSAPTQFGNGRTQVELRIETTSSFTVGLDHPTAPTLLLIEINFKTFIKAKDSEKTFIEYESKYAAQFNVKAWIGFDDWTNIPTGVLSSYFAIVHALAVKRAESTFSEMGVRGVEIPNPPEFSESQKMLVQDNSDSALASPKS